MLTLKLSRVGKKKQPTFRLIVVEKGRDPWGNALEILGTKNPRSKVSVLNVERINHWLEKGAQMTNTVHNLLVDEKIIKGDKRKTFSITNRRGTKINEAKAQAEEAKAKAQEVKAAAEAEAKAAAEAPVEAPTEEPIKEETPAEEPKAE